MIGMQFKLTLPCSALPYSALAFQSEQPCLEIKPFVRSAQSPFLADENQTCPLTCSQGPKDSMPGHSWLLVASNCFLSQKKKVSLGTDLESYHLGKYLAGQNVLHYLCPSLCFSIHPHPPTPPAPAGMWRAEDSWGSYFSFPGFKLTTL